MANCRKGEITMSEVKMTREEIYSKLSEKIQEELDRIRNDYEFGVIEKAEFEELSDEVKEKMAFILDFKPNRKR